MKQMKLSALVLSLCFFTGFTITTPKKISQLTPKLHCHSAAVIDQSSGRVLFEKNGNVRIAMASTTKIMTAIVAIEQGKLASKTIVTAKAAATSGSSAGLSKGESITLEELTYGLMLKSGNDAAIALAEAISGSVDQFVEKMNEKAIELGLFDTHFTSPHGLDSDGHYTTATELAKLTAYALKNRMFAAIVATKSIHQGKYGTFNRSYNNINKFLYGREDADGVKTGFTGNAGKCLVASIKHPYGHYIAVVLNSGDRWRDADKLVKYAEQTFTQVNLVKKGLVDRSFSIVGKKDKVYLRSDLMVPLRRDGSEHPKLISVYAKSRLSMKQSCSPIAMNAFNERAGNVVVMLNNEVVCFYPSYSCNKVEGNE